jgi:toluene monooxygenase electron transfer component
MTGVDVIAGRSTTITVVEGPAFTSTPGDTLLRAALRAGVPVAYECNSGGCGSCKFTLESGGVESVAGDPPGLSERDRRKGRLLACQSIPTSDCAIVLSGIAEPTGHARPERLVGVVTSERALTHDLREITVRTDSAARFLPGQFAMLRRPHAEDGQPLDPCEAARSERAYSMSNLPNDAGDWQFQIKRVPDGRVSPWLVDELGVGDRVELDGPYGLAHLRDDARDIVCIAGGSGLAPMVSVARGLAARPDAGRRRLDFFYGGRTPADLCAREFVDEVSPLLADAELTEAVSDGAGSDWNGATGFVHEVVAAAGIDDLAEREIYVAGPPPMTDAVMRMLVLDLGVQADRVHFDRFF